MYFITTEMLVWFMLTTFQHIQKFVRLSQMLACVGGVSEQLFPLLHF